MHNTPPSSTNPATAFYQEEAVARLAFGAVAAALYLALWLYGGASWGSFWVAALGGTLALLVLAGPLGLALFVLIKAVRWLIGSRAPL